MIILHAEDVKKALPMDETIASMKSAYAAFSSGKAEVPLRAHLSIPPYDGTSLFMPAFVQDESGDALALKAVSVFPGNAEVGLPTIHAAVLLLEAQTGRVVALLEGGTLTAIRTGAASGAATDILARQDVENVAIFGAGIQGRTQLQAVCTVRKIKTAWIYDPNPARSEAFVDEVAGKGPIPTDLRIATDPAMAASSAEVICTATTSQTPVYKAKDIQPGTHINGIGSYTLDMIENPPEIFDKSALFVDSVEAVMAEAGEIAAAIEKKITSPAELSELGDVVLGNKNGRTSQKQITFFKSVGIAVQDALAARLALSNAFKLDLGQNVTW